MVSSLISVAYIYIIRVPLYKLAEKMADSLQKLNKTKQKEEQNADTSDKTEVSDVENNNRK